MIPAAHSARRMLDAHGYAETESIYNEWNYVNSFPAINYETLRLCAAKVPLSSAVL